MNMSDNLIKVNLNESEDSVLYYDVVKDIRNKYDERPLLVKVNGEIKELRRHAHNGDIVEPLYFDDKYARQAYINTAIYIFHKAAYEIFGNNKKFPFRFNMNNGYYFESADIEIGYAEVDMIKEKINEIVSRKIIIDKKKFTRKEALKIFDERAMVDVALLFTYNYKPAINVRSIEDYIKYVNGELTYDTSYIEYYDLMKYDDGVMFILPDGDRLNDNLKFKDETSYFKAYKKSVRWATSLKIDSVGRLNKFIAKTNFDRVVLLSELKQTNDIENVAEEIIKSGKKMVGIAGPSASGKTTFSYRLINNLAIHNKSTRLLSCDNFYKEWKDRPRDENGNIDHESLQALDTKLLNQTISDLLKGKEVYLPIFHFDTGTRTFNKKPMKMKENDILIIEGIHCINNKLYSKDLVDEYYKIFLMPLPAIALDNNNRIQSTDLRLLRRIVRDYMTRGHSAKETLIMWEKVKEAENKWIFPCREDADIVFNTSLIFELNMLKNYAQPLLFDVADDEEVGVTAMRLAKILNFSLGAYTDALPANSIFREFIGTSIFTKEY